LLDRHRPHRRLLRPAHPPPAIAGREPPPQPRALHGRPRPAPQRHPRPRLLPPPGRRRQDPHGSDALPAPPPVRRGLPPARRRRPSNPANGPGRALRGDSIVQRGRPSPGHRHFGPATSRTRTPDATPATGHQGNPRGPDRRPASPARPRCQRAAPYWTNDVDTDQRRRTIETAWAALLTTTRHRREPDMGAD